MAEPESYMLTTTDNPFSPFTQWNDWYNFDAAHGYDTPSYLARVVYTSHELSDADQDVAIDWAIDEILEMNVLGIYRKISEHEQV